MRNKLPNPEINVSDPFLNCKLNRKVYGDILTDVVKQYVDGCVLAIDGEWGVGKTTFVKMWRQVLINEGFHTLYFNVWEDDFISDPIIGLVNQFRHMEEGEAFKAKFVKVALNAGKVFSSIFPAVIKGIVKNQVGDETVDAIEAAIKATSGPFLNIIEDYQKQCDSIEQFKRSLIDLISDVSGHGKPLIFIVDELDRCNPHYAVRVLERIKHLFSVPNIVFVLSIDKNQLCNSICGYFGSEHFNAEEYLKRFIDIEYILPEPDIEKFSAYLYDVYGFDEFFGSEPRCVILGRGKEKKEFIEMTQFIFEHMHLNLRQMEKICAHIRLALQTFRSSEYVNPSLILMLMCFRLTDRNFYDQILKNSISAQELLNHIEEILPKKLFIENESSASLYFRSAVWDTARLIVSYNLNRNGHENEKLIENDDSSTGKLLLNPKLIQYDSLLEAVMFYTSRARYDKILPLNYIIHHIELLSPFH